MKKLNAIFQKQGGWKLIRKYWQSRVLSTAVMQFVMLGKSRTALEILRLSVQMKVKKKIKKRYYTTLVKFDQTYSQDLLNKSSNKVWVCWFQGLEHAPSIVKKCYESLKNNLVNREIILLTAENFLDYVQFPEYIIEKWHSGIITHAHMTDLLRLELLIKYGGTWIDATVFCSRKENEIPAFYFESDLFVYQCLKPGRDGHSYINSSWYMNAKSNNKVLMAVRHLCYEYWKSQNVLKDYFLLHCFMAIALEYFEEEWNNIIPICNSTPHILLLRLFEPYKDTVWDAVRDITPFHKLSYKFDESQNANEMTYYSRILGE